MKRYLIMADSRTAYFWRLKNQLPVYNSPESMEVDDSLISILDTFNNTEWLVVNLTKDNEITQHGQTLLNKLKTAGFLEFKESI